MKNCAARVAQILPVVGVATVRPGHGHESMARNPTAPADTTPPSPAPVLTANTVTSTWLSFSWTASQDSGSEVLYTVYLDGMSHLSNLPWRFANVFGLTPSSTHELRVDAHDNFGNVSQSNFLSITTPAPTNSVAPTPPANVRLGFQSGNGEAGLSWDPSTDDADPQHLIAYEIYFNGLPNYPESIIGGNSTIAYCTMQGIGLTEVVLRAVDTSGNRSAPSNAAWVDCCPSRRAPTAVDCGGPHHRRPLDSPRCEGRRSRPERRPTS